MGRNLPLIILLILLLVSGFIALKFYTDAQQLYTEKQALVNENTELMNKNRTLKKNSERLEKENKEFEQRWREVLQELSEAERKIKDAQSRYEQAKKERDILERKMKEGPKVIVSEKPKSSEKESMPEHWEDVVRAKAELTAGMEELKRELLDTRAKIADLDRNNKELSIQIDQLTKVKERLEKDVSFKERTMQIMSKDLVNEREKRQALSQEVSKLRDDNIGLKQEMIVTNKEKSRLQTNLKNAMERREDLERKVEGIEKVLKEKTLLFEQLKDDLVDTLQVSEDIAASSSSVNLPPIVVEQTTEERLQPNKGAVATGIMQGNVLAVNQKERFAIIDMGADAGVNVGDKFEVYRGNRFIGIIEVIETRREVSAADIKSGSPIAENDIVISK